MSSSMFHHIFVKGNTGNETTIELLKYIHSITDILCKLGIRLVIHKITEKMLKSKDAINKLKETGINNLPSLAITETIIEGSDDIMEYYDFMIQKAMQKQQQPRPTVNQGYQESRSIDSDLIMQSYMNRELNDNDNDDDFPEEDGSKMLEKRCREYMAKMKPPPPKSGKKSSNIVQPQETNIPEQLKNAYRDQGDGDGSQDDQLLQKLMDNIGYE